MRKSIFLASLVLLLGVGTAAAQSTYTVDTVHSSVGFKIRHLVSKVSGEFTDFDAKLMVDFDNLDASSVEFTMKTASIDTGNEKRDDHLRSEDFFAAEKHPEISFRSTKITKKEKDVYVVTGILTMRGVSNPVLVTVEYLGEIQAFGGTRLGFDVTTTVDRQDFDISWNRALDQGGVVLGDDVDVFISLAAVLNEEE